MLRNKLKRKRVKRFKQLFHLDKGLENSLIIFKLYIKNVMVIKMFLFKS